MTPDLVHAIVLGIVQGLTEFLPISSSAHLVIVPHLMGWPDFGLSFDVALHLGTLAALVIYFRSDWARLGRSLLPTGRGSTLHAPRSTLGLSEHGASSVERGALSDRRLVWAIALGCVPAVIAGVLLERWAETTFRNPLLIAGPMILMALAMAAADRFGRRDRTLDDIRYGDALAIGLAQALALVPGVSRSGATLTAGMALGFQRADAARFSFLLSAPITAGAALFKLRHLIKDGIPSHELLVFTAGILASGIVGYLAIAFLLAYLRRGNLLVFVIYRLLLGILLLALFLPRG